MTVPQAYLRREWLNPELSLHTSYIMSHIEDTREGTNKHGSNLLLIADCTRVIQLEFFLGNEKAREESLAKIILLLEILGEFRDELLNQAALISLRAAKQREEGNDVR